MKNILLLALLVISFYVKGQSIINKVEYFFDNDPGIGKATNIPVTPSQNIDNVVFEINANTLSAGLHKLYIRTRDDNGRWSLTSNSIIYKQSINNTLPVNVNRIEYFFDTDPGKGLASQVNFSAGLDIAALSFEADINALSTGIHWLYVRSKTNAGPWSITAKQLVYKAPSFDSAVPSIAQMEYFINTDPGIGKGVPLVFNPADSLADFSFPANIAGLSNGSQAFYVRSKDDSGKWSLTAVDTFSLSHTPPSQAIVVNSVNIPANQPIVGGESLPDIKSSIPLSSSASSLTVCAGKSVSLAFDPRGNFLNSNAFTVELSNKNGSFSSPFVLGQFNGKTGQILSIPLPRHLPQGSNYRLRILSSNPTVVGDPNKDALTINDINIGNDTTVTASCINSLVNLNLLYNTSGLTTQWNTTPTDKAPIGEYRLIVNNSLNCPDTAFARIVLATATWTGAISTDWHTAGNWSSGKVPDSATHVIINTATPRACIISTANAEAASVQVKASGSFQQTNGRQLIIQGRCTILPTP